jgi:hypothetical protein
MTNLTLKRYIHPSMLYKLGVNENRLLNYTDKAETHSDVLGCIYSDPPKSDIIKNKFDYFNIIDII